jgi:hypothetical protein
MELIEPRPVSTALKIFAAVAWVGVNSSAAVSPTFAQSSAKQAIELLRLSLECPVQPYVRSLSAKKGEEEIVARGTTAITFEGNEKLLKIVETLNELLHYQTTNVHFPRTLKILPSQAKFSDLSLPVEIVQDDRRWFGFGDRPRVVISCSNGRACVANGDGVANDVSFSFPVCNHDLASDAKAAIEELIRLNSSATAQPPVERIDPEAPHDLFEMDMPDDMGTAPETR